VYYGGFKIVNSSKLSLSDLAYRLSNKGKVGLLFITSLSMQLQKRVVSESGDIRLC